MSGPPDVLELPTNILPAQRRTVRALFVSQVCSGVGVGTAAGVGSLLIADISHHDALAGLAGTANTFGGAVLAFPLATTMVRRGRRFGLSVGYLIGILGAVLVCLGAALHSVTVVLLAMLAFGASNGTNLQARYAATDLASPQRRGRSLAIVVWATTIGAVIGPNLMDPSSGTAADIGLPALAGPFAWSILAFAAAIGVIQVGLRPDPLLERYRLLGPVRAPTTHGPRRLLASLRTIAASKGASIGLIAMVCGQISMTAVMSMTPVHMRGTPMGSLRVIGVVISLHIAGMYALSPLVGVAVDRFGSLRVMLVAPVLLWASAATAGLAPDHALLQLSIGLFLLGLGWSVCLVAGSALLSLSLPDDVRTDAQGAADLAMGVLGALGGALAGVVLDLFGYADLNLASAVLLLAGVLVAVPLAHTLGVPGPSVRQRL